MPTQGQKALAKRTAVTPVNTKGLAQTSKAGKGMGFKAAAKSVAAKQGLPVDRASAIVAAGRAKASKKAVAANPNLKKVPTKGSKKQTGGMYK